MKKIKQQYIIPAAVVIVLVIGLGSFFSGVQYQKSKKVTTNNVSGSADQQGFGGANGANGGFGQRGQRGGRPTSGTVETISSDKITVKTQTSTVTATISSTTTVTNGTATAAISDIKVGDTVLVAGTAGTDGVIAATRIVLNPTTNMSGPPDGAMQDPGAATQGT